MPALNLGRDWPTRLLAPVGAAYAGRLKLAISLRPDRGVPAREAIVRGYVADRAMQARGVVALHEGADYPARILQAERRLRSHGFGLQRAMPALHLAGRLRVVRRRADVIHPTDADELLKVPGDELRIVVADQARLRLRVFLRGLLLHEFHFVLRHRLPDVPVQVRPATPIRHSPRPRTETARR